MFGLTRFHWQDLKHLVIVSIALSNDYYKRVGDTVGDGGCGGGLLNTSIHMFYNRNKEKQKLLHVTAGSWRRQSADGRGRQEGSQPIRWQKKETSPTCSWNRPIRTLRGEAHPVAPSRTSVRGWAIRVHSIKEACYHNISIQIYFSVKVKYSNGWWAEEPAHSLLQFVYNQ